MRRSKRSRYGPIDDSVVMLGDSEPRAPARSVYVYVRDVDVTYARALAAGATSVEAPVKIWLDSKSRII